MLGADPAELPVELGRTAPTEKQLDAAAAAREAEGDRSEDAAAQA